MNIYDATMKAAQFIEDNPHRNDYSNPRTPIPGGNACMLGWVGQFMGFPEDKNIATEVELVARFGGNVQSGSMLSVVRMETGGMPSYAKDAVAFLRHYANKYFKDQAKPVSPPDWNALAAKLRDLPALTEALKVST